MQKGIFSDSIKILQSSVYDDYRGSIFTVWDKNNLDSRLKKINFVLDKFSHSRKNVLRGFHGDYESWKLLTCVHGEVYFVLVDRRYKSDTYNEWDWIILSNTNRKSILIPPGFGGSFYVLSDSAVMYYKWAYDGEYPDIDTQFTVKWNDKSINVKWPTKDPILSERDDF